MADLEHEVGKMNSSPESNPSVESGRSSVEQAQSGSETGESPVQARQGADRVNEARSPVMRRFGIDKVRNLG